MLNQTTLAPRRRSFAHCFSLCGVLFTLTSAMDAAAQAAADPAAPASAETAPAADPSPAAAAPEAAPAATPEQVTPFATDPGPANEPEGSTTTEEPHWAPLGSAATEIVPSAEEVPVAELNLSAFVDASYAYTTARSGSGVPPHHAFEANSFNGAAGRLANNGFALNWFGVDANYDAGAIGATASLRFGSSVPVYHGGNATNLGIENLTQAYVSWRPLGKLELDFGQFGTIYGAEVAESWKNLNYTRGGLYYLMQPAWHTGLRATYEVTDALTVRGLIVNGANSIVDDNDTPSLGAQVGYSSGKASVTLGYLGALEPSTDGRGNGTFFHNFFDLVATLSLDDLTIVANADFNYSTQTATDENADGLLIRVVETPAFWGASLAAGYQFSHLFGAAIRGELLQDVNNRLYGAYGRFEDASVFTVTGTIDIKPIENSDNFVVRWDNRVETANHDVFVGKDNKATGSFYESVVGIVVKTDE